MREIVYQGKLIKKIQDMFPGCFILRNDPEERQGIPDILILFEDRWAMLEIKISKFAYKQPNQNYFVNMLNEMSFASFINPENENEVLNDLQSALGVSRQARISKS